MLIGQIFFRGDVIVLRDVSGSEETLTFDDALQLHVWLSNHLHEIEERVAVIHQSRLHALQEDEELPYRPADEVEANELRCGPEQEEDQFP